MKKHINCFDIIFIILIIINIVLDIVYYNWSAVCGWVMSFILMIRIYNEK